MYFQLLLEVPSSNKIFIVVVLNISFILSSNLNENGTSVSPKGLSFVLSSNLDENGTSVSPKRLYHPSLVTIII